MRVGRLVTETQRMAEGGGAAQLPTRRIHWQQLHSTRAVHFRKGVPPAHVRARCRFPLPPGLETFPSPTLGAPLLKDANSWLECAVTSRMEAGDHILVYAQVLEGKVLDENAPTAVLFRKVGNHY